ncbi:MAG: serine/threonine protein kinase [Gemmataceae bacterium]|nr:serine/threonine protein kinase [Gemmataceae bacterium]
MVPDATHTPLMAAADREQARSLSLRGVRPPLRVPGYEQEAFVGHGAYGEVWVAVDSNSGRKVAIKFYTRRGGTDWAALAREVEKLRYLFNDRYVVQLLKVGWEADPPYYVMEYLEHGSLEDLLRHGPLPVADAVALFRDIAVGLVHAHNKGILHCDLKPANVLLDHDRRPHLADFGQSRLTHEMSPALGTLFYMAPEQADLKAAPDARWDVYALGAVVYRVLTGDPPHRADPGAAAVLAMGKLEDQLAAYRELIARAPPPSAHRSVVGMDPGLATILDRCLAASPRDRYPNPQAVLSALDGWQQRRVRRPLLALTAAVFAALLVVSAVIGTVLFRDAVATAREQVTDRAVEGNRFAAREVAGRLAVQFQYRWQILEHEARDPQLRAWLATPVEELKAAGAGGAIDAWLADRKARYDPQFDAAGRSAIWFADNRAGLQLGTAPPSPDHRWQYRGYRDYFHGLGRELDIAVGPPPGVITRPHRSVVYRRKAGDADRFWTVAFSVPVWPAGGSHAEPVGVLGLTLDLSGQSRTEGDREGFAVLIDTRPDATGRRGLVVRHPHLDGVPAEAEFPRHYADEVVAWADSGAARFPGEEAYTDPVGDDPGGWLAAAERVVVRGEDGAAADTGLVVLVQAKRGEVLEPVRELRARLGRGVAAAAGFVVLLVAVLWAGLLAVVDARSRSPVVRLFRRWTGLPTADSGTSATGTGATPVPPGTGSHEPLPRPLP